MHFTLLFGSYRHDRKGVRVVRYLVRSLQERGHEIRVVDAGALQLPIFDRMYREYPAGEAPPVLQELAENHRRTDAFILVAGEYNHGVQPGLKNLLDVFQREYFWRPSAIVPYSAGAFAGLRGALHLRAVTAELGMPTVPTLFAIGKINETLSEDGEDVQGQLGKRAARFFDELEWYAEAFKLQRERKAPPY